MERPSRWILEWAADSIGPGATVVGVRGLKVGRSPWMVEFVHEGRSLTTVLRLADIDDTAGRMRLRVEVAALELANRYRLAAPGLLACDLDGTTADAIAVLTTMLPGSSKIAATATPQRLRALGDAAARLHAIALEPMHGLPRRTRPLGDVDFRGHRAVNGTTELLRRAQRHLDAVRVPDAEQVFVHGDLWLGNTVWTADGRLSGMVDWDAAGVGPAGIDLGALRLDVTILYGARVADDVVNGWERVSGHRATNLAYWDLVAASCTTADLSDCVPTLHQLGRGDLDAAMLNARRDHFLTRALERLSST